MPSTGYQKGNCPSCKIPLQDPVQLTCGHSFCESCASDKLSSIDPKCPECKQKFYVICQFLKAGCSWKGNFKEYEQHRKICPRKTDLIPQEKLFLSTFGDEQKDLTQLSKKSPLDNSGRSEAVLAQPTFQGVDKKKLAQYTCSKCKQILKDAVQPACGHRICQSCADEILAKETNPCCPECGENFDNEDGAYYFPDRFVRKEIKNLVTICNENSPIDLQNHLQLSKEDHLTLLANKSTSLEKLSKRHPPSVTKNQVKYNAEQSGERRVLPSREQYDFVEQDGPNPRHSMTATGQKFDSGFVEEQDGNYSDHTQVQGMMQKLMQEEMKQIQQTLMAKLRSKDDEIAGLKATVTKLEKTVRSKNAELEDRDFRLSLIENSNHDGTMIWKIPQFSQRKADAQNGKYTSIFSLPFYTGRYGYKMCLRLYIMGDGIGKGTHLSLFFVVMRGEFDNILQWPFTHKVTFKLINQAGGRDIVDTFQPDPMSSSFQKPKSDMNVASGCPRFVSHTELERGGFIVDDTIFIKCMIDISTVHHP